MQRVTERGFDKEFKFRASRSSGKGGQHVNKVSTKVELVFNIPKSKVLDIDEKILLKERLRHKLSRTGDLRIVSEKFRSQFKNKKICIERFYRLMEKSLKRPQWRNPTEPTKASVEKRYKLKHSISEKKQNRKKIDLNRLSD
ncbi:MAG TPA: alternative ribosome rescue aminoacyl-tRNA hydrolase ArfB [Chitinophagales bacterium]|nr:alternative ribosome rescue aminoacyl-tRNA hydrolase ArfB [Chitinophagales bacterium]